MAKRPGLAEVQCSRIRFEAGDRVIVKHFGALDSDQKKRLRKTINRWAGVDVEVLIVDSSRMEIQIEKNNQFRPSD